MKQEGLKKQSKQYLKDVDLAELIGRSVGTLRNDRLHGRGVPYTRIGRSIFYDLDKVIGPKGFGPLDGYGLLQKGYDQRGMMNMMNYNYEYYIAFRTR